MAEQEAPMSKALIAELKKNADQAAADMTKMIAEFKLSGETLRAIDKETRASVGYDELSRREQIDLRLANKDQAKWLAKIDARDEQTKKNDAKLEKEKKIRDEKAQERLEEMTSLGKWGQKMQLKAAKLAQTAKGKVVDFAKDKIDGIKKAAGSLMDLLGKGLGLAALYLVFEAIKRWDIMGLWESAKSIGSFLGTFGLGILSLATSIGAWFGLESIKQLFTKKEGSLTKKLKSMRDTVKAWFTMAKESKFITGLKNSKFLTQLTGKDSFFSKIKNLFSSIGGLFKKIPGVEKIMKFVKGAGKLLGKIFVPVTVIMALWEAVSGFMDGFANTEGNWAQKILGGIGGALKSLLDFFVFGIADMVQSAIVWLLELFGFDSAAMAVGDFNLVGRIKDAVFKAIDYVTELFSFRDTSFSGIAKSLTDILFLPLDLAINFIKDLFGWGDPEEPFKFSTFIIETWDKVVAWVKGLFTFNSPEEDSKDGFLMSTIKEALTGIKEWFGKMIKFDSASNILTSMINVLTFFPNLIKDAILTVTEWLLGLFGFGEEAKKVANAKNFSISDMIMSVVETIVEWFGKLFDIDVGAIFKKSLGALGEAGAAVLDFFNIGNTEEDDLKEKKDGIKVRIAELKSSNDQLLNPEDNGPIIASNNKKIFDLESQLAKLGKGGLILPGGIAMVGESGPELVINQNSTAKVIPAKQSAEMMSGMGGGSMVNAPTTNVVTNNNSSSSGMMMASSSIDPMHAKYFRS